MSDPCGLQRSLCAVRPIAAHRVARLRPRRGVAQGLCLAARRDHAPLLCGHRRAGAPPRRARPAGCAGRPAHRRLREGPGRQPLLHRGSGDSPPVRAARGRGNLVLGPLGRPGILGPSGRNGGLFRRAHCRHRRWAVPSNGRSRFHRRGRDIHHRPA